MKRAAIWCIRIVAAITALLGVTVLATLTWVDRTSYRELPAYEAVTSRLEQLQTATNLARAELRAGFGRAKLTPAWGGAADAPGLGRFRAVPLAGYGARKGKPAVGVHREVWAKAAAFAVGGHTGVVVTADALIVPREVADLAFARLHASRGLPREAAYFGATHTHASLGGWGEGVVAEQFAGAYVPGIREWFAQQLTQAATRALDDLSPASVGHGGFAAPAFVRNRLLGERGPVDSEFSLLSVKQADGDTAALGAYAAHATVLGASNLRFSGDYPGYWAAEVERTTGGLALFLAGGMGSHGPRAGAPGFEGAERMGTALAELSLRALEEIALTNRVTFGMAGVKTPLPALQIRVSETVRLRPWIARRLLRVEPFTFLQGFRLGDALWLSTPCDFSGELALRLKASASRSGLAATVTSFNGDYVGYVIPAKYYSLGGYEPRLMSFYGPQLPDFFMDVLGNLTTLLGSRSGQSSQSSIRNEEAGRPSWL